MGMLKLSTASGGSITLDPTNTASNLTITVPAQTATLATLTTPSFASTIGVGGATAAASGAGITFPATQSASTDANTLDDYEEGTWTPNLSSDGTPPTVTYSAANQGTYTKIGNTVRASFALVLTSISGGSGGIRITGLPFTNTDYYPNFGVLTQNISFGGSDKYFTLEVGLTATFINLMGATSGTRTVAQISQVGGTATVQGCVIYKV